MMEMTLAMFEPRSLRLDVSGGSGVLSREQIVAAISYASVDNELGWQATRAMHCNDIGAIQYLLLYFNRELRTHTAHCAELPGMAVAALLGKPIGSQINSLVHAHPLWDRERRRASKVKALIDKALSASNYNEAARLSKLHDEILSNARARCEREILENGRCPKCQGTGTTKRKHADCGTCAATGRIKPDMQVIEKASNSDALRAVHSALDSVGSASALFLRELRQRLQQERDAFDC